VRVTVPDPARFALHKLIVAANRDVSAHTKSIKDAAQAGELLKVLMEARPQDIERAANRLIAKGTAYTRKAREGAKRLDSELLTSVVGYLGEERPLRSRSPR
jgi:hypothetical protein